MTRCGVIDVGSNTIRLCVYDVPKKKSARPSDICKVFDAKQSVGLSAYMDHGRMSPDGVLAAVKTLRTQVKRANLLNCNKIWAFATAALRNCSNSQEAVQEIEEGCGVGLDVVSGADEAKLGLAGARFGGAADIDTLVDIGGGSTELTRISPGGAMENVSLPQGSLSSYVAFVDKIIPTDEELDRIGEAFRAQLDASDIPLEGARSIYGLGGTVRTAARVYGDLFNQGVRLKEVRPEHLERLFTACREDEGIFAHELLRTSAQRVHTLLPGCALLREVFTASGAPLIHVTKYGVREGYLLARIEGRR